VNNKAKTFSGVWFLSMVFLAVVYLVIRCSRINLRAHINVCGYAFHIRPLVRYEILECVEPVKLANAHSLFLCALKRNGKSQY